MEMGLCQEGAPGGPTDIGSDWGAAAEACEQGREGPPPWMTYHGGRPGAGGAAAEAWVECGQEREGAEAGRCIKKWDAS